jgi:hypothetical protein
MNNHRCVECRWCELTYASDGRSIFRCKDDGKKLPSDVVSREACARFEAPPATGHWGA